MELLKSAAHRLGLLAWVITVTAIAIFPLLILTAIFITVDTILYVATALIPGVDVVNFRFLYGKGNGPGGYLYRWYNWITQNMNVIFSSVPDSGKWTPPILG